MISTHEESIPLQMKFEPRAAYMLHRQPGAGKCLHY
jgi:hypothetical protein